MGQVNRTQQGLHTSGLVLHEDKIYDGHAHSDRVYIFQRISSYSGSQDNISGKCADGLVNSFMLFIYFIATVVMIIFINAPVAILFMTDCVLNVRGRFLILHSHLALTCTLHNPSELMYRIGYSLSYCVLS